MSEKFTSTAPIETPLVNPEAIDEGDTSAAETGEVESPSVQRLREARERLSQLLDERETPEEPAEADEELSPETDNADDSPEDKSKTTPEKKEKRNKNVLKKIGAWAVESLEANGFIPQPSTKGFLAKGRLWHQRRKEARVAGFLSAEANAQLNGETEDTETESRRRRLQRRIGQSTLVALAKPKTWKEIRDIKQ